MQMFFHLFSFGSLGISDLGISDSGVSEERLLSVEALRLLDRRLSLGRLVDLLLDKPW